MPRYNRFMNDGREERPSQAVASDYWESCNVVERCSERLSGSWVFRGTRVPVHALFENLMAGASVNDFLEWFPGVDRGQVEAVLEHESRALVNSRLS